MRQKIHCCRFVIIPIYLYNNSNCVALLSLSKSSSFLHIFITTHQTEFSLSHETMFFALSRFFIYIELNICVSVWFQNTMIMASMIIYSSLALQRYKAQLDVPSSGWKTQQTGKRKYPTSQVFRALRKYHSKHIFRKKNKLFTFTLTIMHVIWYIQNHIFIYFSKQ